MTAPKSASCPPFSAPNAPLTFSPAAELDGELLVHVLAQVEDVLLLRPLSLSRSTSALCASTTTPSAAVAAASTASPAPECASLRHVVRFEIWKRAVMYRIALTLCSDVQRRAPKLVWPGPCSNPTSCSAATERHSCHVVQLSSPSRSVSAGPAGGILSAPTGRVLCGINRAPRSQACSSAYRDASPPHHRALADYAAALAGHTGACGEFHPVLRAVPPSVLMAPVGTAAC
jgi:hypothetical protein